MRGERVLGALELDLMCDKKRKNLAKIQAS